MMKYLIRYLKFLVTWDSDYFKRRMKGLLYLVLTMLILIFSIVIFGVANVHFNWEIGKSPIFVDGSGYLSRKASPTSNLFELKEVTSEFSVGDIITIGGSKKEHEIRKVTELQKYKVWKFSIYYSYGWCWIRNKCRDESFSC